MKIMNKFTIIFIIVVILVIAYFFLPKKVQDPDNQAKAATNEPNNNQTINSNKESQMGKYSFPGTLEASKISNKKAIITTNKGVIEFELLADAAPETVSNFVYLAENNFYDGLTFHRVVPNFVIQGGDPNGTGTGGPGYKFEDEKVIGEYKAGTVAMANSGPDTNGSQFFICLEDLPSLPKNYSLFGQVTSGMDVVQKIAVGDKMTTVKITDK
jgi:cyclophilin family peptidyl-prolyl cis-trans isomerase/cbb3-type cytochrome oxidase subunit 3